MSQAEAAFTAGLIAAAGLAAGWLLSLVVVPGPERISVRLGLATAMAVPAVTALAVVPMAVSRFGQPSVALCAAVLAGIVVAIALLRRARGLAMIGLEPVRPPRQRRWWLALALGTLLVVALFVVPQLLLAGDSILPMGTTAWYYWRLADETAAAGALPGTIFEWGAEHPFPTEYLPFTAVSAILAAAGVDPLVGMEAIRLAVLGSTVLAALYLWRRWMPGWWALTAAVLTVSLAQVAGRGSGYRPEAFGLALVLWSGSLFDRALEQGSWRLGLSAGLVSATAFLAHAEVWLLTGPLLLGIGVGRLVAPLVTIRGPGHWRGLAAAVGALVVTFTVGVLAVPTLAGAPSRLLSAVDRPPPGPGPDPTWTFVQLISGGALLETPAPTEFTDPLFHDRATFEPFAAMALEPIVGLGALAGIAIIGVILWRPWTYRSRRWAVVTVVFIAGVVLGAVLLFMLYETYVPARAGPKRILPYWSIPVGGAIAFTGWSVARAVRRVLRPRLAVRRADRAALAVTVVLSMGPMVILSPAPEEIIGRTEPSISDAGHAALVDMSDLLPDHAMVLANAYTDGSLSFLTARGGWLDGRAPYLEDVAWLESANTKLADARAFFEDPVNQREILPPEVTHIVVAGRSRQLGGYSVFPVDREALQELPELRLVGRYDGDSMLLYEVVRGDQ